MANNVNIKVVVDDSGLERMASKAANVAKVIRGGLTLLLVQLLCLVKKQLKKLKN